MAGRRQLRQPLPLVARIRDGRIFQVSRRTAAGTIYMRCQNTTICQATAKMVGGELRVIHPHSDFCFEDERVEPISRFKAALQESLQQHWWGLKDLYDTMAQVYPEAALWVPYQTIKGSMKRWRRASHPPAPDNIEDFVRCVLQPEFERHLEYNTGRLSVALITDDDGHSHTLLYDAEFVQSEMQNVDRLFLDGTFRTKPQLADAYQLVTVIGIKFNHGIPFMWAIMSRKTQLAYTALLSHIRDNLIPRVRIRLVMTDFEVALRNAVHEIFPTAQSTGCNTHFDRALLRKAKSFGLQPVIERDPAAKEFLKTIMGLAYLPADAIPAQFDRVKEQAPPRLRHRFRAFTTYFERFWLRSVRPDRFSVYGLSRRTNNISESYNSRLRHNLQDRPAAWDFLCKLLKLQSQAKADVARLRNGLVISRHARYETIFKRNQLTRAWRDLHLRTITTEEFLEIAACLKGDVSQQIRVLRDQEADVQNEGNFAVQQPERILENDPDYDQQVFAANPPEWLLRDNAVPEDDPDIEVNNAEAPHQLVVRPRLRRAGNDGNASDDSGTSSEDSEDAFDEDDAIRPVPEGNIADLDRERGEFLRPDSPELPNVPEQVPQLQPAERVPQPQPAEQVPQPRPAEQVPQPRPVEQVPQPQPAEQVPQPQPAEQVPQAQPAEQVPQSRPAEQATAAPDVPEQVPQPQPAEQVPQPRPVEQVPQPQPVEQVPQPQPVEQVPQPRPVEQVPRPPPAEQVPQPQPQPAEQAVAAPDVLERFNTITPAGNVSDNNIRGRRRNRRKRRANEEPNVPGPTAAVAADVPGPSATSSSNGQPNRRRADKRRRIEARVLVQAELQIQVVQAQVIRERVLAEAAEVEARRQRALAQAAEEEAGRQMGLVEAAQAEAEHQRALAQAAQAETAHQKVLVEAAQADLARQRGTLFPECNMCVSHPMSHAFLPCGHMSFCETCAYRIYYEQLNSRCPNCRKRLTEPPLKVYVV